MGVACDCYPSHLPRGQQEVNHGRHSLQGGISEGEEDEHLGSSETLVPGLPGRKAYTTLSLRGWGK